MCLLVQWALRTGRPPRNCAIQAVGYPTLPLSAAASYVPRSPFISPPSFLGRVV